MAEGFFVRKIKRNWQDYGALSTIKKSLAYLLKPVFERVTYRLYRIRTDAGVSSGAEGDQFVYRLAEPDDSEIISQIEAIEEWLSGKLRKKLVDGEICLVALDGKRVAGFNLVAFGKVYIPLIKKQRVFRPREAWSEQITVHTAYRKRGLASTLRRRMFVELGRRNIKKLYGGTLRENQGSLKLSAKVGFEVFADVKYTGVLGYKTYRFRRVR
jgi:L-amino acid N-acyltransferase YncA